MAVIAALKTKSVAIAMEMAVSVMRLVLSTVQVTVTCEHKRGGESLYV